MERQSAYTVLTANKGASSNEGCLDFLPSSCVLRAVFLLRLALRRGTLDTQPGSHAGFYRDPAVHGDTVVFTAEEISGRSVSAVAQRIASPQVLGWSVLL